MVVVRWLLLVNGVLALLGAAVLYRPARRSLMFAAARASLQAVLAACPEDPANAAVAAEITRLVQETGCGP